MVLFVLSCLSVYLLSRFFASTIQHLNNSTPARASLVKHIRLEGDPIADQAAVRADFPLCGSIERVRARGLKVAQRAINLVRAVEQFEGLGFGLGSGKRRRANGFVVRHIDRQRAAFHALAVHLPPYRGKTHERERYRDRVVRFCIIHLPTVNVDRQARDIGKEFVPDCFIKFASYHVV